MVNIKIVAWVLGILFLSAVVLGFNSMLGQMTADYGVTLDNETWASTYDVVGDMGELSGKQQAIALEEDADADNFNPFFKLGVAIRVTGDTLGMLKDMSNHFFSKVFKGAANLISFTSIAIVILLSFAIISALRKWDT